MSSRIKSLLASVALILLALFSGAQAPSPGSGTTQTAQPATAGNSARNSGNAALTAAFAAQRSNVQLALEGSVSRLLSDDNDGSRHQRFIVTVAGGMTVLVAHNIDLAPRVHNIRQGDAVALYGEYEWNPQGGVLHWTHHDPAGKHTGGWIKHQGLVYQ